MHATWDRPNAPLDVGPIVVQDDYAIAGWTQGAMGGRALLRREQGSWNTILCAGDGIGDVEGLEAIGLPIGQAEALADRLAQAETQVSPERLAMMASFRGIVRMSAGRGGHAPDAAKNHH